MKIRLGHVTNSSSSSFMILCKGVRKDVMDTINALEEADGSESAEETILNELGVDDDTKFVSKLLKYSGAIQSEEENCNSSYIKSEKELVNFFKKSLARIGFYDSDNFMKKNPNIIQAIKEATSLLEEGYVIVGELIDNEGGYGFDESEHRKIDFATKMTDNSYIVPVHAFEYSEEY